MSIAELKHEYRTIRKAAESIVDLAEKESRSFTPREQLEFDKSINECRRLDREIRQAEEERIASRPQGPGPFSSDDDSFTSTLSPRSDSLFDRQGRVTRALLPGESFEQSCRAAGRFQGELAYPGLSLGSFCRAAVLGPQSDVERRALSEGTDSAGGFSVPDILSARLIDALRARTVVLKSGAETVPLSSDVHAFCRLAGDVTPAWRAESAGVGTGDPTFARVTFTARSLAILVKCSFELLQDSLNVEQALQRSFVETAAIAIDKAALIGTGTPPEPKGLKNITGIQEITGVGTLGDFTDLLDALKLLELANVDTGRESTTRQLGAASNQSRIVAVMSPRSKRVYSGLIDQNNQPLQLPMALQDIRMYSTSTIPDNLGVGTNESLIFVGDFSELAIGIRSQLRIEILKERYADTLEIGFLAHLRADIQTWHAPAFVRLLGVL